MIHNSHNRSWRYDIAQLPENTQVINNVRPLPANATRFLHKVSLCEFPSDRVGVSAFEPGPKYLVLLTVKW